ncbi:DUF1330 domain-containing protein [Sphingosinithalassobacter portus]|uniref:DUF1330 domain-containing protein n=1 Tax=Stakelama portus TaxID=2676234 RepID=UPI001961CE30|nr:DUF1330 domain-containing protein [Sphingosinithalassobacter portus]
MTQASNEPGTPDGIHMAVYAIARISIHDRARYDRYAAAFLPTLAPYGGTLLAADEAPVAIEGILDCGKVILLRFPDMQSFRAWESSPEYRAIAVDRREATTGTVLVVNALA